MLKTAYALRQDGALVLRGGAWIEYTLVCLRADRPLLVWGPPGIGKTERMLAICRDNGWPMVTILLREWDPADFSGAAVIVEGQYRKVAPAWVEALGRPEDTQMAVLFLDEFNTARRDNLSAALTLVTQRRINETCHLPRHVRIVAAANPLDQAQGGFRLGDAMHSRFVHIHVEADVEDWAAWATAQNAELGLVASFLRSRSDLLIKIRQAHERDGLAFPTPRGWAAGSEIVLAGGDRFAAYASTVGAEAASEFVAWLESARLPNPEDVAANPRGILAGLDQNRLDIILAAAESAVRILYDDQDRAWDIVRALFDIKQRTVAVQTARAIKRAFKDRTTIPHDLVREVAAILQLAAAKKSR